MSRRIPTILLAFPLLLGASAPMTQVPDAKLAPGLADRLERGGADSFLVLFDDAESLEKVLEGARLSPLPEGRAVYDALRTRSRSTQERTRAWLAARGIPAKPLWIGNGLQVFGDLDLARALAVRPEVVRIVGDPAVRGITLRHLLTMSDGISREGLDFQLGQDKLAGPLRQEPGSGFYFFIDVSPPEAQVTAAIEALRAAGVTNDTPIVALAGGMSKDALGQAAAQYGARFQLSSTVELSELLRKIGQTGGR